MERVATLLDRTALGEGRHEPVLFQGKPLAVPIVSWLRKSAHVSGNQIDVLHCPFCGSGDVVSRGDGSIECGFCDSAFTVTVSPMYPAFPMSVNGQPYPWPGRPADMMDPSMGGDPAADGSGFGGSLIPGGGDGDDADAAGEGDEDGGDGGDDGPPWAKGGDGDADDESGDDDTEAEVGGKKQPPFGKKKSSLDGPVVGVFQTATGAEVPEEEFLRHLAIRSAHDPAAMAERIRAERHR